LRVLGNELELPHCDYRTPSDVTAEIERELGAEREPPPADTQYKGAFVPNVRSVPVHAADLDLPIYAIDALVRRSEPLQDTVLGRQGAP
jgi:hypothetical protein